MDITSSSSKKLSRPVPTAPSSVHSRAWLGRGYALLIAGVVAVLGACSGDLPGNVVVGSGDPTSETRELPSFSEIDVGGGIGVDIVPGSATSIVVTAQPNLLPLTTTKVDGDRLTIATSQGYTTAHGISVKVTTSKLTGIELHGGASASGDGFKAQSLKLNLSGGAHLDLSGEAKDLQVEASGGAVLRIGGLKLTTARVDLSGGVVATMSVSSSLTGQASGGVVINLDQRPATVDVQTSGGAVVLGS